MAEKGGGQKLVVIAGIALVLLLLQSYLSNAGEIPLPSSSPPFTSPSPVPTSNPNATPTPSPTASPSPTPTPPPAPLTFELTITQSGSTYVATNLQGQQVYSGSDASTIINNALGSASSIEIRPGSYLLTGRIVPLNNKYLMASSGAALYQSPLTSLGNSISLVFTQNSVSNFTLDGGHWNGNKGSLSDHRGTSTWNSNFFNYFGIGFYGSSVSGITIKNVFLENVVGQGIDLFGATNCLVQNCTVNHAGDNPLTIEYSPNSNSILEYNTINGGQDVGLNTWECSYVTIRYNSVSDVTDYGGASHWGLAPEQSDYITVIGNTVSNCAQNIVSYISTNVVFTENTMIGGNPGMVIQSSNIVEVAYNDFTQAGGAKFSQSDSSNVNIHDNIGYP